MFQLTSLAKQYRKTPVCRVVGVRCRRRNWISQELPFSSFSQTPISYCKFRLIANSHFRLQNLSVSPQSSLVNFDTSYIPGASSTITCSLTNHFLVNLLPQLTKSRLGILRNGWMNFLELGFDRFKCYAAWWLLSPDNLIRYLLGTTQSPLRRHAVALSYLMQ